MKSRSAIVIMERRRGAILKGDSTVKGTATAARIWNTGAIGMAVAYSRFEIAILLSLMNFITLRLVGEVKEKVKSHYGDTSPRFPGLFTNDWWPLKWHQADIYC